MKANYLHQIKRFKGARLVASFHEVDVFRFEGRCDLRVQYGSGNLDFSCYYPDHLDGWVYTDCLKKACPDTAAEIMQFCETYAALIR